MLPLRARATCNNAPGLSVVIALYNALEERRYDLAVMRTLGASRGKLFGLLMTEGVALSLLGAMLGLGLGHLLASALGAWLEAEHHYPVTGLEWRAPRNYGWSPWR